MELRERRDDDIAHLVTVAARVRAKDNYPIFLPHGDLAAFLTTPEPVAAWVAVRSGRIVGHVALNGETSRPVMRLVEDLVPGRRVIYVARLLVDPDARCEGVGRRLLDQARRTAVTSGHLPVLDVVDTPAATAAISLYRRDGWEEVGQVSFGVADSEIDELIFCGPGS